MTNDEERLKIFAKSPTETLRKCLNLDFIHGNNFPHQFQVITKCQEGWTPSFFTPPSIYSKIGEELATQLAQASQVASSRSNRLLEEESGRPKWAWFLFAPLFLLNTPISFLSILAISLIALSSPFIFIFILFLCIGNRYCNWLINLQISSLIAFITCNVMLYCVVSFPALVTYAATYLYVCNVLLCASIKI